MAERYRRGFFFVIRKNCEIIIAHSQNWQGILRPKCTFRADSCAVFAIINFIWPIPVLGPTSAILYGMKTTRHIKETKRGWLDKDSGHIFKTASHVLHAAKAESKRNANGNELGMVSIEWESTTTIGAAVVRAIQGA